MHSANEALLLRANSRLHFRRAAIKFHEAAEKLRDAVNALTDQSDATAVLGVWQSEGTFADLTDAAQALVKHTVPGGNGLPTLKLPEMDV